MDNLVDRALAGEVEVIGLLFGVVLVLFAVLYLILGQRGPKGRSVLLTGLCDGGKTVLYSRLVLKLPARTHTSITTNIGIYKPEKGKALNIVDIPGHERLRLQLSTIFNFHDESEGWNPEVSRRHKQIPALVASCDRCTPCSQIDQHKKSARALAFVVDSLTLQKEVKDVAEYLYTLLTDDVISGLPMLIACNKHDLTMAKGAKVVQSQLEKEINTLRTTRSSSLESTSQTSNNNTFLGARNKDFQFSDLRPFKVEFVECSAKDGDIGKIVEFLDRIA